MNLSDIITKCYILALIIRDDGERLLLGDDFYEFKENLQHFQPNTFVNDVVELQGTDGQLLAGQVRRTAVQTFEGFIADGTIGREQTETNRRRFLQFFRKKHFYTVVYILPDGSAVQRDRGYIVNAPSVPELYQRFPEYSVGLNFEDPNYYEYDEGEDGEEIPAHSVVLSIANLLEGGLIWDAFGAVSNEKTWLDWENGTTIDGFYTYSNGLAGAPLEFTQLDGNATQQTYTGKNLLPSVNTTRVRNDVTFTHNADGSVSMNGTATADTAYPININSTGNSRNVPLKAGNYVVSGGSMVSANVYIMAYYGVSGGPDQYTTGAFTLSADGTMGAYIYVKSGTNTNGYKIFPQVEAGSSPTDYEKFVGGIPSPNPDFPQVVNTVANGQTVLITGKNIFDKNMTTTPGMISDTGVIGGSAGTYHTSDFIPIGPNTSYVYSGAVNIGGSPSRCYYDANKNFISGVRHESQNPFINTSPANARYMRESIDIQNLGTLQIEKGSQATTYEPYHGQSHEINLGKNLFDSQFEQGSYSGTTGAKTVDNAIYRSADKISVEPNTTYTLSLNGVSQKYVVLFYDNSEQYLSQNASLTNGTFTTLANARYIAIRCFAADYTSDFANLKPQLELGAQATSYAPYKTPIELAGVGPIQSDDLPEYHDSFKRIDGVWYKHAEIGKAIYNGAEDGWATQNDVFVRNVADVSQGAYNEEILVISDHFTGRPTCYRGDIGDGKCAKIVGNNQQIGLKYSALNNDVDAWKTWLGTHNTTVYYALATPTDTAITDTDLLAQLNTIASTFDGVNNITITPSAGAQGELSVHYATGSIDVGAGYEWEEGSDSGTNIIVNNGIDSVNPTWIVPGPATNPTLTNITTGQTIVWEGSVASGQTLTVDLNRQTAELGGTNVFAQLSGDWVRLAPGPNKLAYSATGATEGCRLEWNGVVG